MLVISNTISIISIADVWINPNGIPNMAVGSTFIIT